MSGTTLDDYTDRYAARMHGMKASEIRALFAVANRPEVVSLAGGMPFTAALPLEELAELTARLLRERGVTATQYGPGQGELPLRELICEVMGLEEIEASADDVVVTVGSQHGLALLAQVFLDPGDVVLAEGPSYVGALGVFSAAQAEVMHVPMDEDGLRPDLLLEKLDQLRAERRRAKFVYTVPNYHNPAGVTLAAKRRDELIAIAEAHDLLIVEDNPYGLLGFEETPSAALRARSSDRVIYLGSFSKTFAAGMRTGWILAPHAVRAKLVLVNEAQILSPSMFTQLIVTEYLTHHPWREQLKVFRELYRERRDTMLTMLEGTMPPDVTWTYPRGGFYVWMTLPHGWNSKDMLPRALTHKVAYVPGTGFYADGGGGRDLRLSYCFPKPDRIREGVRRLATVLSEEAELRNVFGRARATTSSRPSPAQGAASLGSAPGPELM